MAKSELAALGMDETLRVGLDLGIGSCGWAAVLQDSDGLMQFAQSGLRKGQGRPLIGSRCFPVPEEPDSRELLGKIRRQNRLARRVTRRRAQRKRAIRAMLSTLPMEALALPANGPMPKAVDKSEGKRRNVSPWDLRAQGLDRALTPVEWGRVLIHMAAHRGFQSNSKSDRGKNAPNDQSQMLGALEAFGTKLARCQMTGEIRTAGEMMAKHPDFATRKRNRGKDYSHSLKRDWLREETRKLFEFQRRFGTPCSDAETEARYLTLAFDQRPIDDGTDKRGPCQFLKDLKRTSRYAPSFERFRLLQRLANLRLIEGGGRPRPLTQDERHKVQARFGDQQSMSFKTLRGILKLDAETRFDGVPAEKEGKDLCAQKGTAYGTTTLRKAVGDAPWARLPAAARDLIAEIVTTYSDLKVIGAQLAALGLDPDILAALMQAAGDGAFSDFKGIAHVSAEAARRLNARLELGGDYKDACAAEGWDHAAPDNAGLDGPVNPVVARCVREALGQFRAICRELGRRPGRVGVELARDIGKSPEDRKAITDGVEKRTEKRKSRRNEFITLVERTSCSDEELKRYELWKEQNGFCAYGLLTSSGTGEQVKIGIRDLLDDRQAVEIDHVLPYSRSGDNGYTNLVLCTSGANRMKRDRTPWEWAEQERMGEQVWNAFERWVESLADFKGMKKRNLLTRTFAAREEDYRRRHLQDTRWAGKVLLAELRKLYPEEGKKDSERRLHIQSGGVTALLRQAWGLEGLKKDKAGERLADDRNHAFDAAVVAAADARILQSLTRAWQRLDREGRQHWGPVVERPWPNFRDDLVAAREGILVSRSEKRRGRGKGHDATIRAADFDQAGRLIQAYRRIGVDDVAEITSVEIKDLKEDDLPRLAKPGERGEVRQALANWIRDGRDPSNPPKGPDVYYPGKAILAVSVEGQKKKIATADLTLDHLSRLTGEAAAPETAAALRTWIESGRPDSDPPLWPGYVRAGRPLKKVDLVGNPYQDREVGKLTIEDLDFLARPVPRELSESWAASRQPGDPLPQEARETLGPWVRVIVNSKLRFIKDPSRNRALVRAVAAWIEAGQPAGDPPRLPNGHPVANFKIRTNIKSGFAVRGGWAENGDMARVDVFAKGGKFYLVPVYVHQIANEAEWPEPPNRAITRNRVEAEWAVVDTTFDFRFSLYPDAYVQLTDSDGRVVEGYYRSTDRDGASIKISPTHRHDQAGQEKYGTKTLAKFRKFHIDRLGRKHEILREDRLWHGKVVTSAGRPACG